MEIVNTTRHKERIDSDDICNLLTNLNYEFIRMERELEVEKELNIGKDDIIAEKNDYILLLEIILEKNGISIK